MALLPRLFLAILLLTAVAPVQDSPAPGPETDATLWSGREAAALGHLQRLLGAGSGEATGPVRVPTDGMVIPGYRVLCFARGDDDAIVESTSARADAGLFLLAWPIEYTAATRRGLMLHGDGTAMFCELTEHESHGPGADLVTGKGSAGRFADVLRQPGNSATGHFWLWLQQVARTTKVEVVDDDGKPRIGCQVMFVGADTVGQRAEVSLPAGAWPAGQGVTDEHGKTRVVGPRCNDLRVVLVLRGNTVVTSAFACETNAAGLRIVLDNAAVQRAHRTRNESAAIATLKNIASAQWQCQASGVIDVDNDGAGEYGYFGELTGDVAVRGETERKITPPVLSAAFRNVTASCAERSGYLFRIYLPSKANAGVPEAATGGGKDCAVDPDAAERLWCCYAWPAAPDSGQRAFFVNQAGDVLACDNTDGNGDPLRVGRERAIAPESAFVGAERGLAGEVAANRVGADQQRWTVVN